MLQDILLESTARLRDVRLFFDMIKRLSSPTAYSQEIRIAKGLFFVHLYGAYEYTITLLIQKTIQTINSMSYRINDCQPILLSIILDSQCKSLSQIGRDKQWSKRHELFHKAKSAETISIDTTIFSIECQNIKYRQLKIFAESFCIKDPVLPRMSLQNRVEELVENRNAIAHGRESPADIGGRYSFDKLEQIYKDIDELCTYIIQVFESYLNNKDFLI